ncbi:MAG: hypothetical protein ACI8WT_004283 [Clostridium sp.]|jgi:hypothetical protein
MIVNFDSDPRNSVIYTSSIILSYLKRKGISKKLDDVSLHCFNLKMEYSLFFLSIDWMYLVGIIKEINERNELILCD